MCLYVLLLQPPGSCSANAFISSIFFLLHFICFIFVHTTPSTFIIVCRRLRHFCCRLATHQHARTHARTLNQPKKGQHFHWNECNFSHLCGIHRNMTQVNFIFGFFFGGKWYLAQYQSISLMDFVLIDTWKMELS